MQVWKIKQNFFAKLWKILFFCSTCANAEEEDDDDVLDNVVDDEDHDEIVDGEENLATLSSLK